MLISDIWNTKPAKVPGRIFVDEPLFQPPNNCEIDAYRLFVDEIREDLKNRQKIAEREEKAMRRMRIKNIYVNEKKLATTVLWEDGTHTTVKLNREDKENGKKFDVYSAVCAAIAKKVYGTNSKLKRIINEKVVVQGKGKKPQIEQTDGGICTVEGFVADEWYKENFKGE